MFKPTTSAAALANQNHLVRCQNQLVQHDEANALRQLRSAERAERDERTALHDQTARRHTTAPQSGSVRFSEEDRLQRQKAVLRRQVRRDDAGLRELETQLRAAYVSQGIRAQMAEREAQRLSQKLDDERSHQAQLLQRQRDADDAQLKCQTDQANKQQFRRDLLTQIDQKRTWQQRMYAEFVHEKREIDRIAAQFYEEGVQELLKKCQQQQRLRDDIAQMLDQKAEWQRQQQLELDAENGRIAAFVAAKLAGAEQQRREEAAKAATATALGERLGRQLLVEQQSRLERQELLDQLSVEELEQRAVQQARAQLARRLRERLAARAEIVRQCADRQRRRECAELDEKAFRAEQLAVLAERDRLEQLSDERRRRHLAEHMRVVAELLADRRNRQRVERERTVLGERAFVEEREMLQQIVEEERIKILQEHAAALGGVFPRGILRENDLAALNL